LSVSDVTTVGHVTIYRHKRLSPQKGTKGTKERKQKPVWKNKIHFVPFCG